MSSAAGQSNGKQGREAKAEVKRALQDGPLPLRENVKKSEPNPRGGRRSVRPNERGAQAAIQKGGASKVAEKKTANSILQKAWKGKEWKERGGGGLACKWGNVRKKRNDGDRDASCSYVMSVLGKI